MDNKILNVFRFNGLSYAYESDIFVVGGPSDCDWSRWAMLHSPSNNEGTELYRLYCFKSGSNDTIYQFGYNENKGQYEYGYESIEALKIIDKPISADTNTFAMLHDGEAYRMYFLDVDNRNVLHQFVYDGNNYVVESTNPTIELEGLPNSIDLRRAAMLYSVSNNQPGYHFYSFLEGNNKELIQSYYNPTTNEYERINNIGIGIDLNRSDISSFSMLNDNEGAYWCYFFEWSDVTL
jgi:hypothetical protein